MTLLLVGSTGLVGEHVLRLALADARIGSMVAPTRRMLPEHPKLLNPLVDFERLPEEAPWRRADAVICTLGFTQTVQVTIEANKLPTKSAIDAQYHNLLNF